MKFCLFFSVSSCDAGVVGWGIGGGAAAGGDGMFLLLLLMVVMLL